MFGFKPFSSIAASALAEPLSAESFVSKSPNLKMNIVSNSQQEKCNANESKSLKAISLYSRTHTYETNALDPRCKGIQIIALNSDTYGCNRNFN